MNKTLLITSPDHPLYDSILTLNCDIVDLSSNNALEILERENNYETIFDFSNLSFLEKEDWLHYLDSLFEGELISDTTTLWGDYLVEKFNLVGAMACSFYSPKSTVEVWAHNGEVFKKIEDLLGLLDLMAKKVMAPGLAFTYPRVISMIINEAYFALEDKLAEEEGIDTAMKYGVNYPMGPIQWCEKIGASLVVQTLDHIYEVTKDPRYKSSLKLRMKAIRT